MCDVEVIKTGQNQGFGQLRGRRKLWKRIRIVQFKNAIEKLQSFNEVKFLLCEITENTENELKKNKILCEN